MVDTVILEFDLGNPTNQNRIDNTTFSNWSPSLEGILSPPYNKIGKGKSFKSVYNYTPEEKDKGQYVPRLTLYKQIINGGFRYFLYIEFSAPKILFNNNFEEVDKGDFNILCSKLSDILKNRGINLSPQEIGKATVREIHYCKNIILTNGISPSSIMSIIKKANISTRKRSSSEVYQDKGESLHYYTQSRGICIYDKIKELEKAQKTEKDNLEKDSWCQFNIIGDILKKIGAVKSFGVLRIETRLKNKRIIKKTIAPIFQTLYGFKTKMPNPLNLKTLFDADIAKTLLKCDIDEIKEGLPQFIADKMSIEDVIQVLKSDNPDIKPRTILEAIGLLTISNEYDLRKARIIISASTKTWNALIKEMCALKYSPTEINHKLEQVEYQLDKFTSFKLGKIH